MNNIKEYINNLDVNNGETRRLNCPLCNGYKTFTVTNNMGSILWNCYKVTCEISGSSRVRLSVDDIKKTNMQENKIDFVLPDYIVPHRYRKEVMTFCELWDLDVDKLDLHYDVKDKRVVFPVTHNNTILDAIGRSITNRLPKWKRYGNNDLPFVYGCGSVAVVVEDCVSASVIGSDAYVGVAVLGTSLSEAHKEYMTRFSTAIIALDPDALPKTLSFAKELRGYVNDVRVIKLNDDLKYRDENDIINLMNLTPKEI